MNEYNFESLIYDLKIGREIEFNYQNKKYSITNSIDGYWYLYCDTDKIELSKLSEFNEKEKLIESLTFIKINGIYIKDIFNFHKYENSICIL